MSLALRRGVANFTFAIRTHIPRHQPFFGALGPTFRHRFSTSTTLRAQENPIFPNVEDANGTIPAKIRQVLENPELVAAINNLSTVAKEEGLDTFNAKPTPSLMLKVAMNPRLREAFNQFREKVEQSGIVFTQEEIKQFLALMKNQQS